MPCETTASRDYRDMHRGKVCSQRSRDIENSDLLDRSVRGSNCGASNSRARMRAYILRWELQTELTVHDWNGGQGGRGLGV